MKSPPRLTLLCHGRTTARASAFPADEPLAGGEREKVMQLKPKLAEPDRILSSPAHAAWQTAEIVSEDFAIEPTLSDINYGRWTGLAIADVQASEPKASPHGWRMPATPPMAASSKAALLARVSSWLAATLASGGHTIAVTHPHVIRAALIATLGAPADAARRIDIEHLAALDLRSDGKRWVLRSLGRP